ncbi:MAG: serine endoprotease DegQ [Beggiatoa sp. IS2]|nr:MAG: serine endoprotease DegQ [Beggiatoa sp. IS2]
MCKFTYLSIITLSLLLAGQFTVADLPASVEGQILPSLAPMLERVTPAVVNISTRKRIRAYESPLFKDPFFRHFFGIPEQPTEKQNQSLGSGVVIDARKGLIVTNHHVIDKADEVTVMLRDGRTLNANLVGTDPETDVALLKVAAENLTALVIANSDNLRVGDFVVAIGNPFGLGQTVTSGIVSALGRSGLGIEGYEDFIQTDASINPGNSGGALVNLRGELVGINTAILAPNGGNVGIGFAIPVNMVDQIIQHLAEFGEVRRGFLGVQIQDLTPELAKAFGLQDIKGAAVVEVQKDSPAEKAGLQTGDVIIAINDQPANNAATVRNRVGLLRVGEEVNITLLRKGRELNLKTVVAGFKGVSGEKISSYLEGMTLSDSAEGIEITDVTRQSFTWSVGFRKGDLIIGFNRRPIKDVADLKKRMSQKEPPFLIQINRNGENLSVLLK